MAWGNKKDRERGFQKRLQRSANEAGIYAENIHPGIGMKPGFPDMVFGVDGLLFPVELKLIDRVSSVDGIFRISHIRPAQLGWLNRCYSRGDRCGLVADLGDFSAAIPVLETIKGRREWEWGDLDWQDDPIDSVCDALEMSKKWVKSRKN